MASLLLFAELALVPALHFWRRFPGFIIWLVIRKRKDLSVDGSNDLGFLLFHSYYATDQGSLRYKNKPTLALLAIISYNSFLDCFADNVDWILLQKAQL